MIIFAKGVGNDRILSTVLLLPQEITKENFNEENFESVNFTIFQGEGLIQIEFIKKSHIGLKFIASFRITFNSAKSF